MSKRFWLAAIAGCLFLCVGCAEDDDDTVDSPDDGTDDDDVDDDSADDDTVDDDSVDDDFDDDLDDDADDDSSVECEALLYPDLWIAAHRGGRTWAPENTIPAIQKAFELGAHAVEIDVRNTADGQYVLMHDDTVDRTTNGTGLVEEMTLNEIRALKVDDWLFGGIHGDLQVPTLEEALDAIEVADGQADFDMKASVPEGAIEIVVERGDEARVWVYSSNPAKLDAVRSVSTDVRIQPSSSSLDDTLALIDYFEPDPEHIEIDADGFTPENIAMIHSIGARVSMDALGVRDVLAAILEIRGAWGEMMAEGVDIILTDSPAALIDYWQSLCAQAD